MIRPSRTLCGLPSSRLRSMKAPGSPSSPLTMTYLGSPGALRVVSHYAGREAAAAAAAQVGLLSPRRAPAPGVISESALARAE